MIPEPPTSPASEASPSGPLSRGGELVFTSIFWPYLVTTSAILFAPALGIWLATLPFDPKKRVLARFTAEWAAHYLERAPFAGVTVSGQENLIRDRPVVFVSNHQSMVDTLALFSLRVPALWVSKVENFYAPFIGWNMVLNRYVALKRGHMPSIMRTFRTCLSRIAEGHSLIIFPEGTRSLDGDLRHFFRGAFALAARTRVPIVPIVLDGTGGILKKGTAVISPRPVRIHVLPAVDPADFAFDSHALREHVKARMAAELVRMRGT